MCDESFPTTEIVPGEEPQTSELTGLFVVKPESATVTKGLKPKMLGRMEGVGIISRQMIQLILVCGRKGHHVCG